MKNILSSIQLLVLWSLSQVAGSQPAATQILPDESCTVSILNQTASVQPDGTWNVPNVPSNMGPVRARLTCVDGAQTLSGASDFFTITINRMNAIPRIELGTATATPQAIFVTLPTTSLTSVGQTAQATVIASFADGSTLDVTGASEGTVYSTTNPGVATVGDGGLVTAQASGRVLISALHEAVLDSIAVTVLVSGDSDGDGLPDDFELANGLDPNDPVDALEDLDRDGLINREEFELGTDIASADTDGDGLSDGEEVVAGDDGFVTNPLLADTDGDGVRDGLEGEIGTDPTDPASVDYGPVLVSLAAVPAGFTLINNTILPDEVSRRVRIDGLLVDGTVANLTARGTSYASSDLTVANFGAEPGRIFGAADGSAVVTASNSGFEVDIQVNVVSFSPQALSFLRIPGFANGVVVEDGIAYVAAGTTGLQVVDASDPSTPVIVGSVDTPGNANDVRVAGGLVYVADGVSGLQVIDAGNPASPFLVGSADTPGIATDLVVADGFAYVADGGSGLAVIDVGDPASPVRVGQVDTPGNARGIDGGGGLVVVADATGGVHVVDVSNPAAPVIAGSTHTRGTISRAADVAVRDRLAYVADGSNTNLGGLKVVDFSTPNTPVVVAGTSNSFGLAAVALDRNLALAADFFFVNGVPAFDIRQPVPAIRGTIDFSRAPSFRDDNGNGVAVEGGLVFLAGARSAIVDNGSTGDSVLHIGRYALLVDDAGIAPEVRITAPNNGDAFLERRVVRLAASASDDVLVNSVDFLADGMVIGSDFSSPYELDFTLPGDAGTLSLGAVANDLGGNQGFADEVTITVLADNAPTVSITSPVPGSRFTEGTVFSIAAVASDDLAITSVDFFVDGAAAGSRFAPPFTITHTVPVGASELTLTAVATDNAGQSATSDPVVVGVDLNQPPTVGLLEPLDGVEVIEGSTLRVVAGAIDDLGVASVDFFVDGALVTTDDSAPFELDLDVPLGATQIVLSATAVDVLGLSAAAADVTVTVIPDPGTTVEGLVLLPDGSPAGGAEVALLDFTASTDGSGRFSVPGVPTIQGLIVVTASFESAQGVFVGTSAPTFPIPDDVTDVGTIRLISGFPNGNGGFETGDFTGFVALGETAVLENLGPLTAPEGQFMAFLSTGGAATGNSLSSITTEDFHIPAGVTAIVLEFNFLSNEFPDFVGGPFNDTLRLVLNGPDGPVLSQDIASVNTAGFVFAPAGTGFNGMTGFATVELDVADLAGSGEPCSLTFEFQVFDQGDTAVDSAGLVDNLRFE